MTEMVSDLPPLILFHYDFSPWGRKLRAYLALRNIPYLSCDQPVTVPRPNLEALGIAYRRIPLLSIGKDFYCDTDLAISKLEEFFPPSSGSDPQHPDLNAKTPDGEALEEMLSTWIESQVWKYAAYAIPTNMDAVFANRDFLADRTKLFGREWSVETQQKLRLESDLVLRANFEFLENTLLRDSRKWLLPPSTSSGISNSINGTNGSSGNSSAYDNRPGLADVYVGFIFDWMRDVSGCWPKDMDEESGNYPKFWAWLNRYRDAVATAVTRMSGNSKQGVIGGKDAIQQILNSDYAETKNSPSSTTPTTTTTTPVFAEKDNPAKLQHGEQVQAYPKNYGYTHKDRGRLVGLTEREAVIENEKGIRVHHPRFQFIVEKV